MTWNTITNKVKFFSVAIVIVGLCAQFSIADESHSKFDPNLEETIKYLVNNTTSNPSPVPELMQRFGLSPTSLNLRFASPANLPIGDGVYIPVYDEENSIWSTAGQTLMGIYVTNSSVVLRFTERVRSDTSRLAQTGDLFVTTLKTINGVTLIAWLGKFEVLEEARGKFSITIEEIYESNPNWNFEIGNVEVWDTWGWLPIN